MSIYFNSIQFILFISEHIIKIARASSQSVRSKSIRGSFHELPIYVNEINDETFSEPDA